METVEHHGRETTVRTVTAGGADESATTVLYVHGSGGTHRVWGHQYAVDGPTGRAAALDLSGHGDSDDVETEAGSPTLAAYADDVVATARHVGADVLAGNSLGGAVLLHVALERSFEPAGLILAGTGAKLAVTADLREWLAADFERAVDFLHGPDRFFHDADGRAVERSKGEMRATGKAVTRRDFLTCHAFDVRDRLGELTVPALALVGEYDGLTPPRYHEYLAEHAPACACETIPKAAHLAMVERPDAFGEAVERFCAERVEGA